MLENLFREHLFHIYASAVALVFGLVLFSFIKGEAPPPSPQEEVPAKKKRPIRRRVVKESQPRKKPVKKR